MINVECCDERREECRPTATHTCIMASQDRCTKRRVVIRFEFVVLLGVTDFFLRLNLGPHDMLFVMCAVRLIARHHGVACAVSFFVEIRQNFMVCRANQPSTSHGCAYALFSGRASAEQKFMISRSTHDAAECEGVVSILCGAQEMTVSDTVCCPSVLCRTTCFHPTQYV